MPPLRDKSTLDQFRQVLSRWNAPRAIMWEEKPKRELWRDCPSLSIPMVNEALFEHLSAGRDINRVEEQSPTLAAMEDKKFFYEFRMNVDGMDVYVKGRLMSGLQFYVHSFHKG